MIKYHTWQGDHKYKIDQSDPGMLINKTFFTADDPDDQIDQKDHLCIQHMHKRVHSLN